MKKFKSFLPVFNGFYNTYFGCACEEHCIEDGKGYDDYNFDYEDYYNRVARSCVREIEKKLSEFEVKLEFSTIVSPKYYNFENDRIEVIYTISQKGYDRILTYIEENLESFDEFIKAKFTSRSGFVSFYSNDPQNWITTLKYEFKDTQDFNFMGTIFDFILENEGFTDYDLYHLALESDNYVGATLID